MVRPSAYRSSKYSAKTVGDVVKNRIDAQRDSMTEQFTAAANEAVANETTDKETAITGGATTIELPFYLAFGRQCAKLVRDHGANTMTNAEAQDKKAAWETRGLTSGVLISVAANYGLTVT